MLTPPSIPRGRRSRPHGSPLRGGSRNPKPSDRRGGGGGSAARLSLGPLPAGGGTVGVLVTLTREVLGSNPDVLSLPGGILEQDALNLYRLLNDMYVTKIYMIVGCVGGKVPRQIKSA